MIDGRIQVPPSARKGEAFLVRVAMRHPMETGFRRGVDGRTVPPNVIDAVVCRYGGREVFRAELGTGMAANPILSFYVVAEASGELVVEWHDDRGDSGRASAAVSVS